MLKKNYEKMSLRELEDYRGELFESYEKLMRDKIRQTEEAGKITFEFSVSESRVHGPGTVSEYESDFSKEFMDDLISDINDVIIEKLLTHRDEKYGK